MYASVTIDVNTSNLNDTYDYHIPDDLVPYVGIGSRVLVEFGVRKILGYVISTSEETTFTGVAKDINEVLDFSKELSIEQVEMAKKIAHDTKCPLIKALDVMFPSFLKTKYRKFVSVKNFEALDPNIGLLFLNKKKICLTKEIVEEYPKIRKEIDKGNLSLEYDIFTYGKTKYVRMYELNPSCANLWDGLMGMRRKLVSYLQSKGEATIEDIKDSVGCSNYLVNALVKAEIIIQKDVLVKIANPKDKTLLRKTILPFEKQAVLDRYQKLSNKPFLLYSNDDLFNQELYLEICKDNILNSKKTMIITPTLMINYSLYHYLLRNLEGFDVINFSSDISNTEYYNNYMKVRNGDVDVIVTTKVGALLPLEDVGTFIVIDESNFNYINEMTPKYSLVELIKFRGEYHNAKVILSSNPLTIENYYAYFKAEYHILKYLNTLEGKVELVNMYNEVLEDRSIISKKLEEALRLNLKNGKQAMLILNSRGYSNHLVCRSCGKVAICDKCHIPLSYYKDKEEVRCRYCGRKLESLKCSCGNGEYAMFGMGLEMVEEKLKELFPSIRVLLIDSSSLRDFDDYQNAVVKIESGEVDIILGTNNVLYLSNYSNVELISLVSVDNLLNNSDYRASYYTFSLINNCMKKGKVIIQGYNIDHYAINYGIKGDFFNFYNEDIKMREAFSYPPFNEINKLFITGEYKDMYYCANYFKKAYSNIFRNSELVLGPTYNKLKKGVQLILKHKDFDKVSKLIDEVAKKFTDKDIVLSFERYPRSF